MVHVWQHAHGKPSERGYHNKEWAAKMKAIGLQPSSTGMVGGKETGQSMMDYIIPGGAFTRALRQARRDRMEAEPAIRASAGGKKAPPTARPKFTCPACGQNVWGKPDPETTCTPCLIEAMATELGEASPDHRTARAFSAANG